MECRKCITKPLPIGSNSKVGIKHSLMNRRRERLIGVYDLD